eukprot:488677-Prymnesium_polylepis.1
MARLCASPRLIEAQYPCLLSGTNLIDLSVIRAWLAFRLRQAVGTAPNAAALSLVSHRQNILEGLCEQLGVDESTGRLLGGDASRARAIDIRFAGEAGGGDGLRREWFDLAVAEMLDPSRGLFMSKDGNRT